MTAPFASWVSRLLLTRFRSYSEAGLEVEARPVVLAGPNGAGKTNILEALSLLSPGRGLRSATYREMEREGDAPGWAVAARLMGRAGPTDIGTGTTVEARDRRQLRIDGTPATNADLLAVVNVLWLTPAMDRLFVEGASARRKFFDRMVLALYPDHAGHVARYEAAMRERARLLAEARADPAWLSALERKMAEHGVAVAAARRDALGALQRLIDTNWEGPFPKAVLALEGEVEARLAEAKALDVEDWLVETLGHRRGQDQAAGRAGVGIHRTDLVVTHATKAMPAGRCSTGEQKALLIGLVLAQTRLVAELTGRWPLLLLDEVAAHLDAGRRGGLFDILMNMGVQAWMTGTDADVFVGLKGRAQLWTIEAGKPIRLEF
ncbi:DNA replication/repair protein RecF [Pedomonas mirosovicensis]|uniref:DNA replication/repair protein RecF n=1 Tax=Pedomonas mirosovicensis TaxID=2908641 RepID=UPI00216A7BC3|nr:DNA replication/repair protein RecF [Pedomonas mirosovicensis]MCH8684078.1 DNA replication/repair protein RecF [Pedomonas mirosovicensis]